MFIQKLFNSQYEDFDENDFECILENNPYYLFECILSDNLIIDNDNNNYTIKHFLQNKGFKYEIFKKILNSSINFIYKLESKKITIEKFEKILFNMIDCKNFLKQINFENLYPKIVNLLNIIIETNFDVLKRFTNEQYKKIF